MIRMDDAIIDWESILDDLAAIALCLQLSGYLEHCSQIWVLHYKCSRLLQDGFSALRGLAFFCEYSEYYVGDTSIKDIQLDKEIELNFPTITHGLEDLMNLQRQTYQNNILLAVLQIAHYYARSSKFCFAQMLLQYVEQKHAQLSERQGRYDIILATMDAIKFRLLWKHFDDSTVTVDQVAKRTGAENLLLHRCLLHEIEETLDRFYEFSCVSSNDSLLYLILIIGLVQEFAECTVNRLCDNFISALFIATCKSSLVMGLALRFVQVMSMWMWMNLQMEYVDKAQTKLKIIQYVMGIKTLKEVTSTSTKPSCDIQSSTLLATTSCSELLVNYNNPIRKLAQVQLSPIKTNKLQLSPSHRNFDLKHYFKCSIDTKLMPQNEQIEWTFFMIGCLNARLYFLVEDYDQLETFYERGSKWLQMRQNTFNKKYYKNIQLMALQHYTNFLRARRQYDKALQCLENALELCANMNFYIDAVYYVNFQLQLVATRKELNGCNNLIKINIPSLNKLRRALQFNISPENEQLEEEAKRNLRDKMILNVMASGKKPAATSVVSTRSCSSSKKPKTHVNATTSRINPGLKFEIYNDSIEIIEITDNISAECLVIEDGKPVKHTKALEDNHQITKTPTVVGKSRKQLKATATKSSKKFKRPENIHQYHSTDGTVGSSPTKLSSSSSQENLEPKENLNTNKLIVQMQNLEINHSETTTMPTNLKTKTIKRRERQETRTKNSTASVNLVFEDSPCILKPSTKELVDEPERLRTRVTTRTKSDNAQSTREGTEIRSRRLR